MKVCRELYIHNPEMSGSYDEWSIPSYLKSLVPPSTALSDGNRLQQAGSIQERAMHHTTKKSKWSWEAMYRNDE
jgi:hypothetical protein